MGLDMYLIKKSYVQNWDHEKDSEKHEVIIKKGGKIREDIKPERITHILEEVAYWRKANAVHKWFVDNCQDGVDDCREAYVTHKELEGLLELCKKALKPSVKEEEVLPTASGFFFGSTEYDQFYMEDMENTVEMMTEILAEDDTDYYYRSSW